MPECLGSSFVEKGPGILEAVGQQRVLVAGAAPDSLGCFRQSAGSRRSRVILLPLSFLLRRLRSSVSSSGLSGTREMERAERVLCRAMKVLRDWRL